MIQEGKFHRFLDAQVCAEHPIRGAQGVEHSEAAVGYLGHCARAVRGLYFTRCVGTLQPTLQRNHFDQIEPTKGIDLIKTSLNPECVPPGT